jgi:uncharacterized phage protein (TIGR02218 family)
MKKISESFKEHLKKTVTTIASVWSIKLKNETIIGFTDHNEDILYENLLYKSGKAITVSVVESSTSLSADNFEIEAVLDPTFIHKEDVMNGLYDKAYVEYFIVNYADLSQGQILIRSGYIDEIRIVDHKFFAEIKGLSNELNKQTRSIYSETCRAQFKDQRCGADDSKYIAVASITSVIGKEAIEIDSALTHPSIYRNAKLKILNDNKEEVLYIRSVIGNKVCLHETNSVALKIDAKIILLPECDKNFRTCCDIFCNALNFRGEPFVPGIDEMNKTAGTFK